MFIYTHSALVVITFVFLIALLARNPKVTVMSGALRATDVSRVATVTISQFISQMEVSSRCYTHAFMIYYCLSPDLPNRHFFYVLNNSILTVHSIIANVLRTLLK